MELETMTASRTGGKDQTACRSSVLDGVKAVFDQIESKEDNSACIP